MWSDDKTILLEWQPLRKPRCIFTTQDDNVVLSCRKTATDKLSITSQHFCVGELVDFRCDCPHQQGAPSAETHRLVLDGLLVLDLPSRLGLTLNAEKLLRGGDDLRDSSEISLDASQPCLLNCPQSPDTHLCAEAQHQADHDGAKSKYHGDGTKQGYLAHKQPPPPRTLQ